jgi:hypothetical protein
MSFTTTKKGSSMITTLDGMTLSEPVYFCSPVGSFYTLDGRAVSRFLLGHIVVTSLCPHWEKWVKCCACNPDDECQTEPEPKPEARTLAQIFGWEE